MSYSNNNQGFTIVELLIATAVFSVMLLGATFALVQVSRMYYKGVLVARTQDVARNVVDSVSRPMQLEGLSQREAVSVSTIDGREVRVRCIGNQRFTYTIGPQVDRSVTPGTVAGDKVRHVLWRDLLDQRFPCTAVDLTRENPTQGTNGIDGEDLLTDKMRLSNFRIVATTGGTYIIEVGVFYGERDLMLPEISLNPAALPVSCKGSSTGGQWCAFAEYRTQVKPRM